MSKTTWTNDQALHYMRKFNEAVPVTVHLTQPEQMAILDVIVSAETELGEWASARAKLGAALFETYDVFAGRIRAAISTLGED